MLASLTKPPSSTATMAHSAALFPRAFLQAAGAKQRPHSRGASDAFAGHFARPRSLWLLRANRGTVSAR